MVEDVMTNTAQDPERSMATVPQPARVEVEELLALLRLLKTEPPAEACPAQELDYRLARSDGEEALIPDTVRVLMEKVAAILARGDSVEVVPVARELTTQQAADVLNVSRQYVVRLLDSGKIPSRKTGAHRRVRSRDLLAFKGQRDRNRMAQLDQLAQTTQAWGGYEGLPSDDQ